MQHARNHSLTFDTWRDAVRPLLVSGEKPERLVWSEMFSRAPAAAKATSEKSPLCLPRSLMQLLENLACFRHDSRWELMYRLSWRILFENARLLQDPGDPDVQHAMSMDRAIRRDLHKMHAFVRFREMTREAGEPSYFSWFEPQHEILRKGANFFVKRFPNMHWTIATPDGAAVWNRIALSFVDADLFGERPTGDVSEELWRTYYRSICNVARINPQAMQREMPQHYWHNLPESAEISTLMREGVALFEARHEQSDHDHFTEAKAVKHSLSKVNAPAEELQACKACDLWKHATQAVAGEGPGAAHIMLVGEQPGDEEDLRGKPFVGPAGKVLDGVLQEAGLNRTELYITNAVKHFKWEPRGKRRLHKKPSVGEIRACNIWLQGEIAAIKPRVIVALGASALRSLTGASQSIEAAQQMDLHHEGGTRILAAYHPSAILRAEGDRAEQLRTSLVAVLEHAASLAAKARQ
jgi:uracil-DNA glycosylase